jgi:uncharacterized protein (TIGR00645 family)
MEIRRVPGAVENFVESLIFWTRWLLAPAYIVLAGCLLSLLISTGSEFIELLTSKIRPFAETRTIIQVLTIVDLVLVMNLVLLIMFVGYVNFVSKIHPKQSKIEDWPIWMGHLDYSGLKLQLLGSIIAVSAILILRTIVDLFDGGKIDADRFFWMIAFHLTFVVSALIIAVVNKLKVEVSDSHFSPSPEA